MPEQTQETKLDLNAQVVQAAVDLVEALVNVEKDPDLISIFSIANAHGYRSTSKFWHPAKNKLTELLIQYRDDLQKKQDDREKDKVIPFDPSETVKG